MKSEITWDKKLYDLELHQILPIEIDDKELWTSVMRVPGGWIYRSYDKSHSMMSTTFVRFDNEFQLNDTCANTKPEKLKWESTKKIKEIYFSRTQPSYGSQSSIEIFWRDDGELVFRVGTTRDSIDGQISITPKQQEKLLKFLQAGPP